jgi:peptide/nickel transport system substrate-binding protein
MVGRMRFAGTVVCLSLLLAGCGDRQPGGPVRVSVIDGAASRRGALPPGRAALIGATTRGLVRLEADGQVAPDAAVRWAILEDGRDYIFRIDDGIPARIVARKLRAAIASPAASGLRPSLVPIGKIDAVTPTVVEIRLTTPLPELLALLARPELALADVPGAMGAHAEGDAILLTGREPGSVPPPVLLRHERPGKAVARFMAGQSDLVTGGTFEDFGVVRAAAPRADTVRVDPTIGLFGLAARSRLLAEPGLARALGLAIDRDRLIALIGAPGLAKATTIAGSTIEPPLAQRLVEARRILAQGTFAIRVAMPDTPASRAIFALLEQDWSRIGIMATRVAPSAPADLALEDRVAPAEALHRLACAVSFGCDPRDPLAQIDPPFIPLTAPLRWSLVARRLDAFTPNPAATHPLDRLVAQR